MLQYCFSILLVFVSVTTGVHSCCKMSSFNSKSGPQDGEFQVSGRVILPESSKGITLPKPSVMTVTVRDTSLADAPSVLLGKYSEEISEKYNKGQPLEYSIIASINKNTGYMPNAYSVSATISVGRESPLSIQKGDYITDTIYNVDVMEGVLQYSMDVPIIHYT